MRARTVSTLVLCLLSLFTFTISAQAQTPTGSPGQSIVWDHDGVNLDHFEVNFDFVETWTAIPGTQRNYRIPALAPGDHTFYVKACNIEIAGKKTCSDAAPFKFAIIAIVPNQPFNVHIDTTVSVSISLTPAKKPTPKR